MTTTRVTAIVVNYNHRAYIGRALASLLAQTRPVDEVVFCDDGSTDGSLAVAHATLEGLPVTWVGCDGSNAGLIPRLIEAHGRVREGYVKILSCDDEWPPNAVECHLAAVGGSSSRWSVGAVDVIDESSAVVDRYATPHHASADAMRADVLGGRRPFLAHGWMYAISLYRQVGGLNSRFSMEDYPLALAFLRVEMPSLTDAVVGRYRRVSGSMTASRRHVLVSRDLALITLREARHYPTVAFAAAGDRFLNTAIVAWRWGDVPLAAFAGLASLTLHPSPSLWAGRATRFARRVTGRRS